MPAQFLFRGEIMGYKARVFDLSRTPFYADVGDFRLWFSSRFNLERFPEKLSQAGMFTTSYLSCKAPCKYIDETLAILHAYMQTEKRGFRVRQKGVEFRCPEKMQVRNGQIQNLEKYSALFADITLNVDEH